MLEDLLAQYPKEFRRARVPRLVLDEAKKHVLDSIGCAFGAFNEKAVRTLRETISRHEKGLCSLWNTKKKISPENAAWLNGASVRALDFNDTYLSKEPCHPSDLLASFWAASEISKRSGQGKLLLEAMILGYEVMCRLCDANSLRLRGWDHVTYLPIASAVGCSLILELTPLQTRHAIALAIIGNNAMRQTRVGEISDWKAACASFAARSGLTAARLAKAGFTGPSDIFSGRHGFFKQVSGRFTLKPSLGGPWMMMKTHTKFFPAEHHAQSAIEAALKIRTQWNRSSIEKISIDTFDVAFEIIGSEPEKWMPTTRETADHSLPYLVVAALLDGNVTLNQFRKKRFLDHDVRTLLKRVCVNRSKAFSRAYPVDMPNRVTIKLSNGQIISHTVMKPKGYAGHPMSLDDVKQKFLRLTSGRLNTRRQTALIKSISLLEKINKLESVGL